MKKEDVLSNCMFNVVEKKGAKFDNGLVVVPMEYNYVSRAKKNLFVGTKGSVNAFRTYGIEATFKEKGKPYGEYFNEQLKNKSLDTEVHFYTIDGQIHMKEKILACIACLNDDMIILLKEGYIWSIALIDYENMTITDDCICSGLEYIESDYSNRRFILAKNGKYFVVTFDGDSKVADITLLFDNEPIAFCDYGIIIKSNDKYGLMKDNGEIILNCIWDKIKLHRDYIEVIFENLTGIYLYNGDCVLYDEIKSYERNYVKGNLLFKVQKKNGCFDLYSSRKKLLSESVKQIELLSDGTMVIHFPSSGYALVRYDLKRDKVVPILPKNCLDNKIRHFDHMCFVFQKDKTTVEASVGKKVATFDTDGNQLTSFE